jgi:DNA-directed RNA polymerase specialized sigma24 family protein
MGSIDTSIGGEARRFPSTGPDSERFRDPARPEYRRALEDLCRRYWKPVYYYVRLSWARSNEDAKDLTQAFFAGILEGDSLANYRSERGGFRAFLKTLLARFVGHRHEADLRLKRGGGRIVVRLDDGPALEAAVLSHRETPPSDVFDRQWLAELLRGAVDRVGAAFGAGGREAQFRVFEAHDLCDGDDPPGYAELAGRFGLRESQVRDYLSTVRREVRREIRLELERLTSDAAELEEEWKALFTGPGGGGYRAASSRTSSAESGFE